jgi:hypothetical protein
MAEPSNIIMTEEPTPVAPVRSCGSCSLCCKLLVIEELAKPPDTWCPHCKPGRGGCSIYADRPPSCRLFRCGWLDSKGRVGDEWYPTRSKMVLFNLPGPGFQVIVDPAFPLAWRSEPYYSQLRAAARRSPVEIRIGFRGFVLNADGAEREARTAPDWKALTAAPGQEVVGEAQK